MKGCVRRSGNADREHHARAPFHTSKKSNGRLTLFFNTKSQDIEMADERFLESTRGQVLLLLRSGPRTVNELARSLELTDNAVRAHLAALERDRLVRSSGLRAGLRKPHVVYELTPQSERIFPKAYAALLNELLAVLKEKYSAKAVDGTLREVGRRIAETRQPKARG